MPFGFGLSYTNFTFAKAQLLNAAGQPCDERTAGCAVNASSSSSDSNFFFVAVDVTNTGRIDGKVVVQVYFSQALASRVRFAQMLLDFAKVEVAAGAKVTVTVKIPLTGLEMWSAAANRYVVEASTYEISVGQWVSDPNMATHELTVVA